MPMEIENHYGVHASRPTHSANSVSPKITKSDNAPKNGSDFTDRLSEVLQGTEIAAAESYKKLLEMRFGGIRIQAVEKDQRSMDKLGAATSGTGNVVIAPNIFEKMVNDPEKAAYYEGKIQHYFEMVPQYKAKLSMMGFEIESSGIVIHPDGSVTHYCSADLKPEIRRRIEAQIKAEDAAKAKRRQKTAELGKETAMLRKEQAEESLRARSVGEMMLRHSVSAERLSDKNSTRTFFSPADSPEMLFAAYKAILSTRTVL